MSGSKKKSSSKVDEPIKNLQQFMKVLQSKTKNKLKDRNYRIYYRGEEEDYKENWCIPSIFRSQGVDGEHKNYYRTLRHYPSEFNELSRLDILAKMQHHRFKTRLLDITSNPLVALYFAAGGYSLYNDSMKFEKICSSKFDKKLKTSNNGVVYIFFGHVDKILNHESDKAYIISTFPKLKDTDKNNIAEIFRAAKNREIPVTPAYIDDNIKADDQLNSMSKLVYELSKKNQSFQRHYFNGADFFDFYFVKPTFVTDRLVRQNGLFLIFGLDTPQNYSAELKRKSDTDGGPLLVKIKVSGIRKDRITILKELDIYCGINHASLMVSLDDTAKSFEVNLFEDKID